MNARLNKLSLILISVISAQVQASGASPPPCPFKSCHLETQPSRSIKALLEYEITPSPGTVVKDWLVFASRPPDLPGQKVRSASLQIKNSRLRGKTTSESSCLKRPVLKLSLPAAKPYTQSLPVQATYEAVLARMELLAGAPGKAAPGLSAAERKNNLMSTFSIDFAAPVVQEWLKRNALQRQAGEGELDFAWRAYLAVRSKYRYYWTPSLDRQASKVCLRFATDCGGLSYLYCAILRAGGIPARALICRRARSSQRPEDYSGYFNCHVKTDFYLSGVGWVPVDIAEAVTSRHKDPALFFGKDDGNMLVMHTNPDLLLDSSHFGLMNVRSMPDFHCFVYGKDTDVQLPRRILWRVQSVALDR